MSLAWTASTRRWTLGVLVVLAAILLTVRGLGNESYVSTHGDPPRYMMNAMFILDLLRDRPFESLDALREYATLYYARYPALSLGHHPPLISVLQVPFIALLGPSILAARLPMILMFALGVLFLFLLVSDMCNEWAGLAAGLIMAASPSLVYETQSSLAEPTAVALSVVAAYLLFHFCLKEKTWLLVGFGTAAVLSVLAKQNAIAAFPAFWIYAWVRLGWRRLTRADFLVAAVVTGAVVAPFGVMTVGISTFNVQQSLWLFNRATPAQAVTQGPESVSSPNTAPPSASGTFAGSVSRRLARTFVVLPTVLAAQLTAPVGVLCACGFVLMLRRPVPHAWLFGSWTVSTYVVIVLLTGRVEMVRYGAYWVPPMAAFAGYVATLAMRPGRLRVVVGVALAAAICLEISTAQAVQLQGASAYEAAAQHVVGHPRGTTVMFSGDVDTGYFVFFIRKHDAARRAIVLRSDKILTVSRMQRIDSQELIHSRAGIAATLKRLGVGYVVIEDRPSSSGVLEWLRNEVQGPGYIERLRLPVNSRDRRLRDVDLVVYEVVDVSGPASDARLDLRLPIISRQLDVALADLVGRKYLR